MENFGFDRAGECRKQSHMLELQLLIYDQTGSRRESALNFASQAMFQMLRHDFANNLLPDFRLRGNDDRRRRFPAPRQGKGKSRRDGDKEELKFRQTYSITRRIGSRRLFWTPIDLVKRCPRFHV